MPRVVLALVVSSLLGFGTASRAAADDVAVIVNKSNPVSALTMIQLRKILLAQDAKWPGSVGKIVVWMAAAGQPERAAQLKIVCGMSETDFTLHFMHASFNGDSGGSVQSGRVRRASAAIDRRRHQTASGSSGLRRWTTQ